MKRALAERAKQSLVPSPTADAATPSSPTTAPSHVLSNNNKTTTTTTTTTNSSSSSPEDAPPPSKLRRVASSPDATTSTTTRKPPRTTSLTVPDDANAFYLKQQNRALAVEWRDAQYQLQLLQKEREERRMHVEAAVTLLQTLQVQWKRLEEQVLQEANGDNSLVADDSRTLSSSIPSTGTDAAVEWTVALTQALANLSAVAPVPETDNTFETSEWVQHCVQHMLRRIQVLQEGLLIQRRKQPQTETTMEETTLSSSSSTSAAAQQDVVHDLQGQIQRLTAQQVELVTARNQALQAERKLRRNFYKLQAGLLTREQFVKDLKLLHNNNNDEDIDDDVGEWMQEMPNIAASNQLTPLHQSSEDVTMTLATPDEQGSLETHHPSNLSAALVSSSSATIPLQQQMAVSSQQLQQQQQQQQLIQDLQEKLATREESMQSLSEQLLQAEKRINILAAKQLSDTDSQKLETLYTTRQELTMARDSIETLQGKLQHTREQWAAALGNEEAIQQAMEEQQGKFAKKWEEMSAALVLEQSELIAGDEMSNGDLEAHAEDSISKANALLQTQTESQAKQIIILQHKLTQALENVRQAETTREELNDALALNETLHGKMEEIKSKYATMKNLAANNAATANSINNGKPDPADTKDALTVSTAAAASVKDSSGGGSTPTGGLSAEKIEKLHREHRRMRKDLSAMMASKEAAKIKLERAEKERDSLMEMNARLLKQMTEKDEMNAKSLSTILHLKSMTEQLALERDNLEQQAKSASQLALAARLATNAKDRVSEEAALEKHSLEEQLQALENKLASSKEELEKMTREWSEASGKMSTVNTELSNAIHRSDELVEELEKKNAEIRELIGNVRKAERKANECLEKLNQMTDTSGGGASSVASNFTAEQLNIQIGVLKSKLACPVCHYRDKECIIMRCRHLHCKQCVEDRISSRNRKCPTCNNKFSEKDVEDIWLNT